MELKQIGPKTFCIEHDTNIGIHFTDDGRMYLIDTGSKGDGEKIDEILSREDGCHLASSTPIHISII